VRIEGRFATAPTAGPADHHEQPVGPCYAITPWNFRWRWARARSGRRSPPAARW
jgi:acyl-CoA reductase-like NAD-dependent aldehyde dehydrogenase